MTDKENLINDAPSDEEILNPEPIEAEEPEAAESSDSAGLDTEAIETPTEIAPEILPDELKLDDIKKPLESDTKKVPFYKNKFVIIVAALLLLILIVGAIALFKKGESSQVTNALITPTAFPSTDLTETPTVSTTTTPVLENEYSTFSNEYVSFKYPKSAKTVVYTDSSDFTDNVYPVGVIGLSITAKDYDLNINLPLGGFDWGNYIYNPSNPKSLRYQEGGGVDFTTTLSEEPKIYNLTNNLRAISFKKENKNYFVFNNSFSDNLTVEENRNRFFDTTGTTVWTNKEFKFLKGFDKDGNEIPASIEYDMYIIYVNFHSETETVHAQFVQDFNELMNSYKFLK